MASLDETSLSLAAPLALNSNVHGTAFAGSLYAVGVLSAYYLGREWMRREGLSDAGYELVAKSGRIAYKRPIRAPSIVARSVLPTAEALRAFRATLEAEGKAVIDVRGEMCVEGDAREHCEYSIEVCAFRPRR